MKKSIFLLFLFFLSGFTVFSQDAAAITELLQKPVADLKDFSYMVASSAGRSGTPFEAYTFCDRYNVFPMTAAADTPITVKMISQFYMKAYQLNGGILWSIFKSPRYAFRELKHKGLWSGYLDPDTRLSGRELLRIAGKFANLFPEAVLSDPLSPKESAENYNALLASAKE